MPSNNGNRAPHASWDLHQCQGTLWFHVVLERPAGISRYGPAV